MTLTPKAKKNPFSVSEPYPNPCTGSTRLLFSVPEKSSFKVHVMTNGQELFSCDSEEFSPGIATMDVHLGDLPSGHYMLRIVQGDHHIDKSIQKVRKLNRKND